MNTVKIIFSQKISSKTRTTFLHSEITDLGLDKTKIYAWAAAQLMILFLREVTHGKAPFNLKIPIIIHIFWNNKLQDCLTQKKVSPKTYIGNNSRFSFPLKKGIYILITCTGQHDDIDPINPELTFNTIEYLNIPLPKYGSPIIYTGMTN